jgi:hypothetical protein
MTSRHVSKASDPLRASFGARAAPLLRGSSFRSFRNQSLACILQESIDLRSIYRSPFGDSLLLVLGASQGVRVEGLRRPAALSVALSQLKRHFLTG